MSEQNEEMQVESDDCLVCTEPLNGARLSVCRHEVHERCVAQSGQTSCPVCRQHIHFSEENQRIYEQQNRLNIEEQARQNAQASLQAARELQRQLEEEDLEDDEDGPLVIQIPARRRGRGGRANLEAARELRRRLIRNITNTVDFVQAEQPRTPSLPQRNADGLIREDPNDRNATDPQRQPPQNNRQPQVNEELDWIDTGFRQQRIVLTPQADEPILADDCMMQLAQLMYQISTREERITADRRIVKLYRIMLMLNEVGAETGLNVTQLSSVLENCNS